jgi:site-specific DNA-adenine methylase
MVRFHGGKGVIGKRLSEVILNSVDNDPDTIYIELFCGAAGVLRYMTSHIKKCYANDICKDMIMLLNSVKNETFDNPKITKEKWLEYKYSKKSSAERAFAGFACSYSGIFFNGYIPDPKNNDMEYSSLLKLAPRIQNVKFSNKSYDIFLSDFKFDRTKKYIIYLDPPYRGTSCQPWPKFDSDRFWTICRKLGKMKNVKLFISEVSAPSDFKCIYTLKRRNGMHNITSNKIIIEEKLYTI